MMEDACNGKFDYIVTKSISRFARNTVDTLNCVRELRQKNPPIGIYFEKENIDTLDATGELILTILSALAQDESRSISENIRWTFRKNFQAGIPQINLKRMIGYDKGENGEWVINEGQAKTVRYIFEQFVNGQSANKIARSLNEKGQRTVNGNMWRANSVMCVLKNEKFVGDLEMQKTITKDFLTHTSVPNKGEAPRYYLENHHEPIIDRITWDKVQAIIRNSAGTGTKSEKCRKPFFNLTCGEVHEDGKVCGCSLFRQTYTRAATGYCDSRSLKNTGGDTSKYLEKYTYSYPVWRCGKRTDCTSRLLHECAIEQSFMEMLYRYKRDYEENRERSEICRLYKGAYNRAYQSVQINSVPIERIETLKEEIKELEQEVQDNVGQEAAKRGRELEGMKRELAMMQSEQEALAIMGRNFDFFVKCLEGLPVANTVDMEPPYEYLRFERGIYCAFIISGQVRGDEIVYTTNFGVKLRTSGNSRTLDSFIEYRRRTEDGSMEVLDKPFKVCGTAMQYRRYLRKGVDAGIDIDGDLMD
jgi:uncharacterized protein (UPF0335 family)